MRVFWYLDLVSEPSSAACYIESKEIIVIRKRGGPIAVINDMVKAKWRKPDGIIVIRGPGRFSSVRTAALAGNLLSFLFGVPSVGVTRALGENEETLIRRGMGLLSGRRRLDAVRPYYDREPNITIPKIVCSHDTSE